MAQLLYDPFNANGGSSLSNLDTQTVLAVHSFLDSPLLPNSTRQNPEEEEEGDVFQCGKCKARFTILAAFLHHKKEDCRVNHHQMAACPAPPPTSVGGDSAFLIQVSPHSPLLGSVLNESDLLSLVDSPGAEGSYSLLSSPLVQPPGSPVKSLNSLLVAPPPPDPMPPADHSRLVKSTRKSSSKSKGDQSAKNVSLELECMFCKKKFGKNFDLQQHMRSHTGEKPHQCIVCGRAFAQKSNVKKHMQTHKVWPNGRAHTLPPTPGESEEDSNQDLSKWVPNPYSCEFCSHISKSHVEYRAHMVTHNDQKVYKCIQKSCGKMFRDLDPFLEHVRSHQATSYMCHECQTTFSSLAELSLHHTTHLQPRRSFTTSPTPKKKNRYRCNHCLSKYATLAALQHHMETVKHSYRCFKCSKTFTCERYLRRHLQIHFPPSFACTACGRMFRTLNYLRFHSLSHSGVKSFKCPHCSTTFKRSDHLKRHLKLHEPTQRQRCPFHSITGCPLRFSRKDKLKSHLLSHCTFSCALCGQDFSSQQQMAKHSRSKHHPCDNCRMVCATPEELEKHKCLPEDSIPTAHIEITVLPPEDTEKT